MKIPRTASGKSQFKELVKGCKAKPTLGELNKIEVLLGTERSSVTTRHGIRKRLSELMSPVAKDKLFQKKVAVELIEPGNPTPMKLKKHKMKLEKANRSSMNAKS